MPESTSCSKCGALLPLDAPAGLCPKCLVQAGFESEAAPEPSAAGGDPAVQPTLKSPPASGGGFEPPLPAELALLFPQLEILELLGKGGMGAVYKARQRGLDRLVAVKILPPEIGHDAAFAERFTREARALARLAHPHIVAVYDFGQADGLFYIVMEYVDGVNLRQTIQTGGLTPQSALAIVPQICEALQFAHDEGIVHRDIKPENILIDKKGRVKIADFGLAKLVGHDSRDQHLTGTHQVMGTLRYMAPEQLQGSREVDHRADIYSLGVVFYELLTGELPMGKFAPPSKKVQVDVRLDEIVLRALEQEPEQRYQHASEVKTDVETITTSPQAATEVPRAAAPSPAENDTEILLDETDRSARRLQHFALIGGFVWLLLGVGLVLVQLSLLPLAIAVSAGGIGLLVVAGRTRQQWEVDYKGHVIRFENSVLTSGRLTVDGISVASGGIGLRTELSGRIPRGPGAGDRIIAMTWAGFLSFRCRLLAQRQIPARSNVKPKMEADSVSLPHEPEAQSQNERETAARSKWEVAVQTWWHARSLVTRKVLWIALNICFAFCLIGFFTFNASHDDRGTNFRIGALDPWFVNETRPGNGFFIGLKVFAWSWLFGIGACGFGWLLVKLKRKPDKVLPPPSDEATQQSTASSLHPSKPRISGSVWALFGLLAVVVAAVISGLSFINGKRNPSTDTAAIPPAQSWVPGSHGGVRGAHEPSTGWFMSSFGPALTDGFAHSVLELQPRQIKQANDILQAVHREYLELEKKHTQQRTNESGHVVTNIQPVPVDKLENDLWSQLDQVLDAKQQSVARLNLKLDPSTSRVGMTIGQIVEPGFFGWGKEGVRIELWKVGAWFHWKVGVRGYEDSGSAPQLPQQYRRFWKEPRMNANERK